MLTLDDLMRLLRQSAGASDTATPDLDTTFAELGYDSLALLETTALIQREYGVSADEDIVTAATPREFLARLNA